MKWLLSEAADNELSDAEASYDREDPSIGRAFSAEVLRGLNNISSHPLRNPLFGFKKVRRRLLGRFPYAIVYEIREDHVNVLAIMHTNRRPGYWRSRVTKK